MIYTTVVKLLKWVCNFGICCCLLYVYMQHIYIAFRDGSSLVKNASTVLKSVITFPKNLANNSSALGTMGCQGEQESLH